MRCSRRQMPLLRLRSRWRSSRAFASAAAHTQPSIRYDSSRNRSATLQSCSPEPPHKSGEEPSRRYPKYDRSCTVLSRSDLSCASRFPTTERVLHQRLTHATANETSRDVLSSGTLRCSKPEDARYDGMLQLLSMESADAGGIFTHANPTSDGVIYPFSRYPLSARGGDPISICTLSMEPLTSTAYSLFYAGTTPTLFGPRFSSVYHSVVVVAPTADEAIMRRCSTSCQALDKRENRLLFVNNNNEFETATKFSSQDANGLPYTRKHQTVVCFMEDVDVSEFDIEVVDGHRLHDDVLRCPVESCEFVAGGQNVYRLKTHYRSVHTDTRIACQSAGCSREFKTQYDRDHHVRVEHGGTRYSCSHCTREFRSQKGALRHERSEHADYSSNDQAWLRELSTSFGIPNTKSLPTPVHSLDMNGKDTLTSNIAILKSLGATNTTIRELLQHSPWLWQTSTSDLERASHALSSSPCGLEASQLTRVVNSSHGQFFMKCARSGVSNMTHNVATLREQLGLTAEECSEIISKFPFLLSVDPPTLEDTTRTLKDVLNVGDEDVRELRRAVKAHPIVLQRSAKTIRTKLDDLTKLLGGDQRAAQSLVLKSPTLLGVSSRSLQENFSWFSSQFGEDRARKSFVKKPVLLHRNPQRSMERVEKLREMGVKPEQVIKNPLMLACSDETFETSCAWCEENLDHELMSRSSAAYLVGVRVVTLQRRYDLLLRKFLPHEAKAKMLWCREASLLEDVYELFDVHLRLEFELSSSSLSRVLFHVIMRDRSVLLQEFRRLRLDKRADGLPREYVEKVTDILEELGIPRAELSSSETGVGALAIGG